MNPTFANSKLRRASTIFQRKQCSHSPHFRGMIQLGLGPFQFALTPGLSSRDTFSRRGKMALALNSGAFLEGVNEVCFEIGKSFSGAARPLDFNSIHFRVRAHSEV